MRVGDYRGLFRSALNAFRLSMEKRDRGRFDSVQRRRQCKGGDRNCSVVATSLVCHKPPEAVRGQEHILPFNFSNEYIPFYNHDVSQSQVKLISSFWSPELWQYEFLLLQSTRSVMVCYSRPRTGFDTRRWNADVTNT